MDLFVDCDDTLLLYKNKQKFNPYGFWKGSVFVPNFKLIGAMVVFRKDNPESQITVWSGGGYKYAHECATHLGIDNICDRFLTKDQTNFPLVKERDIVVDDDNLDNIRTHDPFQWPEELATSMDRNVF